MSVFKKGVVGMREGVAGYSGGSAEQGNGEADLVAAVPAEGAAPAPADAALAGAWRTRDLTRDLVHTIFEQESGFDIELNDEGFALNTEKMVPVMVTTFHRGIFFGYVACFAHAMSQDRLVLRNARNCLYWGNDMKGFCGLANPGPDKDCKISGAVPQQGYKNITSVSVCTPAAALAWEHAPHSEG